MLLALAGGLIGVASAAGLVRVLRARLPDTIPRADQISLDPVVLAFALGVTLLAVLLFGLPPALRVTGSGLLGSIFRGAAGKAPSKRQHRLQYGLVLVEVALATVLVVSAGLLLKSFATTVAVHPGFEPRGVVALAVSPASGEHTRNEGWAGYFDALLERLRSVPGVESVGGIHLLPLTSGNWSFPYEAEDHPIPPDTPPPSANYRVIAGDYFRTLGIPLLEGRTFAPADRDGAPDVVVINERMARDLWPNESALGKSIELFMNAPFTVVGVVGDVHQYRLDRPPEPEMYYHLPQVQPTGRFLMMVRGSLPSSELVPALRETVWALDPDVPIGMIATLEEVVSQSVARARLVAQLVAGFAALALLLGAVGVYGVMSFAASARAREIGVRMALGADRRSIVGSSVARGMAWALGGLATGLLAAGAAGRLLEGLLFETSATDPAVYAGVALALSAVAALACFVPARRASRLDPMVTLRQE
jgi:putative ABC transport system permease protein